MHWRKTIKNALIGTTAGAVIAGMTLGGAPALAEDTDKKINDVPIGQVMQSIEGCQLSPSQLTKEEVDVLKKCVSEDYLEEHSYGKSQDSSSGGITISPDRAVERSNYSGNLEDFQVDEFRIHDYDGDPRVEGVFGDNTDKGSFLAFFPFGEEDGETYNKAFFLPDEKIMEIREGNLDDDEQKEIGVITDKNVYLADWNTNKEDVTFNRYSSPENKSFTDGMFVDGKVAVSLDEKLNSEKGQWGVYWLDQDGLEPFNHENFDMREFVYNLEAGTYIHNASSIDNKPIEHFVYGDINGDEINEFAIVNDRMGVSGEIKANNDIITIVKGDGSYGHIDSATLSHSGDTLDLDIGNLTPWRDAHIDLEVPSENILGAYSSDLEKNKWVVNSN